MQMMRLVWFVGALSVSAHASDEPNNNNTMVPTNNDPSGSLVPSAPSVTATLVPSAEDICMNTPGFAVNDWNQFYREWHLQTLGCDDILVDCHEMGNLGQVKDHCCKCREECAGKCNDPMFTQPPPLSNGEDTTDKYSFGFFSIFVPFACFMGIFILYRLYALRKRERRMAQEAMIARRLEREQRENNGLTEEENTNLRFEKFVTKFYFQTVSEDKSNIDAESIRKSNATKDEETPTEKSVSFDEGEASGDGGVDDDQESPNISTGNTISDQLASWMKPCAKQECCICLDSYSAGETICAPVTKDCNHVFHESCIKEWLKKNDHCPLCRVNLLSD